MWACCLSLALVQISFALGAVYFKYNLEHEDALHKLNPVVFAFLREATAACVMCMIAHTTSSARPRKADLPTLALLGTLLYFNQLFYILGMEISGVVVACCMQPAIPVLTVAFAVSLGNEEPSVGKLVGIAVASAGAISMVLGGAGTPAEAAQGSWTTMVGNCLLVGNVVAMALYYVLAKPILGVYPAISVAAWAYALAALNMGITALVSVRESLEWVLPMDALGPLLYWIFVCSVVGYYVIAWGMKHLPASQVASFQCLQPLVGTALAFSVLGEHLTWWDLGAVGIVAGLFLVNRESGARSPSGGAKIRQKIPIFSVKMQGRQKSLLSLVSPRFEFSNLGGQDQIL